MTGDKREGFLLQDRDRRLLRELALMRVIDRAQARMVCGFSSDSRTNRRLHKLVLAGLLRRFSLGTNAAGQKALYSLSKAGASVVNVPYRGLQRRNNEPLVADFFIEHQLTVNEIFCSIKYGPAPNDHVTLAEWRAFHQPLSPGRRFIPDAYLVLQTPTETFSAFLEIDLGHERRSVWQEKVRNYLQFAVSREYQKQFREQRFDVLVGTTTERRLASLRTTVLSRTEKIFWFTTLDEIRRDGLLGTIWRRPRGEERKPLIDETVRQP